MWGRHHDGFINIELGRDPFCGRILSGRPANEDKYRGQASAKQCRLPDPVDLEISPSRWNAMPNRRHLLGF